MLRNNFIKFAIIFGTFFQNSAASDGLGNYCSSAKWIKGPRSNPSATIQLRISLTHKEDHGGENKLVELSDPESSHFGQYLTAQEVISSFSPGLEVVSNVTAWIQTVGIPRAKIRRSSCKGHIFVNATIQEAEKLLNAEYHQYTHKQTGRVHIGCEHYSIPETVDSLVDFVAPTVCTPLSPTVNTPISPKTWGSIRLPSRLQGRPGPSERLAEPFPGILRRQALNATLKVDCAKFTTPDCLRQLYNIPLGGEVHPNNTFGIFQPSWSTWLPDDMDKFFSQFQPSLVGQRPIVEAIDGGYMQAVVIDSMFNLEPNLDFQYAMAIAYPQPVINLQVGDMYLGGNLNNLLASFDSHYCGALDPDIDPMYPDLEQEDGYNSTDCGNHVAPNVISISYAYDEAEFPAKYLRRQCLEYLKLGLMGVTVVTATGDFGPAGGDRVCLNPETKTPDPDSEQGLFNPKFPASCPWVTAVGGTQRASMSDSNMSDREEVLYHRRVANHTSSSGGGFSNVFGAPWFQLPHTSTYLWRERKHISEMKGRFDSGGRGTPDVSALASEYLAVIEGKTMRIHGTSASTPVWASMISRINNERMLAGKGSVGFINPTLYLYSRQWANDVDSGHSSGCGFEEAFGAVKGWDAGTGLGSAQYDKLRRVFMRLP
jgi:tripeptidyl-peptidase-1